MDASLTLMHTDTPPPLTPPTLSHLSLSPHPRYISQFDDDAEEDLDGDGVPDEVQEVAQVLWDYRELYPLIFSFYAVSGGSLSSMKLNSCEYFTTRTHTPCCCSTRLLDLLQPCDERVFESLTGNQFIEDARLVSKKQKHNQRAPRPALKLAETLLKLAHTCQTALGPR